MPRTPKQPPQPKGPQSHAKRPGTRKRSPKPPKTATPHRSNPRPPHGTQRPRSPISRKAVRALSIIGTQDKDVLQRFPGLTAPTLRKWRSRDPIWSETFDMLKPEGTAGRRRNVTKTREAESHSVTIAALADALPAIASRNAIRMANEADRSLAQVEKRKRPLPITTWTEAKQAYSVLRLATGQDENGQSAGVQVNIWGVPGASNQGIAPAFRVIAAQPAPAQPAITV